MKYIKYSCKKCKEHKSLIFNKETCGKFYPFYVAEGLICGLCGQPVLIELIEEKKDVIDDPLPRQEVQDNIR